MCGKNYISQGTFQTHNQMYGRFCHLALSIIYFLIVFDIFWFILFRLALNTFSTQNAAIFYNFSKFWSEFNVLLVFVSPSWGVVCPMVHPGGGGVVCPMVHLVGCKADPLRARHPLVGTPHSSR